MSQIINPHTGKPMQAAPPKMYVFNPVVDGTDESIAVEELATFVREVFLVMNIALNDAALESFPPSMRHHFTEVTPPDQAKNDE